ncbi:hypothetical protein, partial [Pyrobaculum aerophilum]|uniref:hypothetical protein n=1 Tax=Pyrobaculum aerophilum TaxID=13773 RepID=UPI001C6E0928
RPSVENAPKLPPPSTRAYLAPARRRFVEGVVCESPLSTNADKYARRKSHVDGVSKGRHP